MSVFLIVYDDATLQVVDIIKRDEAVLFPLGSQQFGPTPPGRVLPQVQSAGNLIHLVELQTVRDEVRASKLLDDAKKQQLLDFFNTQLPGDRVREILKSTAVQQGLLSAGPLTDVPPPKKPLIAVFVDP